MTETHPTLSVPEILSGYRDLGGGWWPRAHPYLSCDPAFNRYTRFWVKGPTLDATHSALIALRLLGHPSFDKEPVEGLVAQHFQPATGTFTTDGHELSGGIYGLHNAIGMLRLLLGRQDPAEPLGIGNYDGAMEKMGQDPGRAREHLLAFLKKCAAKGRVRGGLFDHPGMRPRVPTITTLYTATVVLWNLYGESFTRKLDEIASLTAVEGFIRRCLATATVAGRKVAAFSITPSEEHGEKSQELCANTTFFALDTLKHLHRENLLGGGERRKIVSFYTEAVWKREEGGFSSTIDERPSLNATFFALRALTLLRAWEPARIEDFVRRNAAAMDQFVGRCAQDGGYAFTDSPNRYLPNPVATRYAVEIRKRLNKDFGAKLTSSAARDRHTVEFLKNELFDEASGGYRGYPARRIRRADCFDTQTLYDWDPKKYEDRAGEAEQFFSLLADGLHKAWTLDAQAMVLDKPKKVRLRGGGVIMRRRRSHKEPSPRPRYSLRGSPERGFKIMELPAVPAGTKGE